MFWFSTGTVVVWVVAAELPSGSDPDGLKLPVDFYFFFFLFWASAVVRSLSTQAVGRLCVHLAARPERQQH